MAYFRVIGLPDHRYSDLVAFSTLLRSGGVEDAPPVKSAQPRQAPDSVASIARQQTASARQRHGCGPAELETE
eukprot:4097684-Prymnesium_polylepis.2